MKCLNCSNDIVSKGTKPKKYCSDACRMQYKRTEQTNTGTNEHQTNKNKTSDVASGSTNSNGGEQNCPDKSDKELLAAIFPPEVEVDPNDDYSYLKGPANLKDYHSPHGRRYVEREFPDDMNWGELMTVSELADAGLKSNRVTLPGDWDYKGVYVDADSSDTCQPPLDINKLSDAQLQRELRYKPDTSWVNTPEHKEVIRRMVKA